MVALPSRGEPCLVNPPGCRLRGVVPFPELLVQGYRAFLFAQLRERGTGRLLDLGTKGSGQTPYSRFGDWVFLAMLLTGAAVSLTPALRRRAR